MEGVDCSRLRLIPADNPLSSRVNQLVNAVRSQRPHLLQSVRVRVRVALGLGLGMGLG